MDNQNNPHTVTSDDGSTFDSQPKVTGNPGDSSRLLIGPFADRKSAMEVCAKLKADGASCLLAR